MYKKLMIVCLTVFCLSKVSFSQGGLPSVKIKSAKTGRDVDFSKLVGDTKDTVVIVSFWATWCMPCVTELDNINDIYTDKQKVKPFKLIAVSIDDSRTAQRVKPLVNGKGWVFDIYQDINSDLKRAFDINDVPHIIIIKNGKIMYQHTGYVAGGEEDMFDKIKAY